MKPTAEQKTLLDRFASEQGPRWRNVLQSYWTTGSAKLDAYPGLYAMRNRLGPAVVLAHWTPTDQEWEDKLDGQKRL